MSFRLENAPYSFSKLMSELLREFPEFAVPYLDDVGIFSNSSSDHPNEKANWKIKPSKCTFAQNHVQYSGHVMSIGTRSHADAKIGSVKNFPTSKTKTHVRALLCLAGYYDR